MLRPTARTLTWIAATLTVGRWKFRLWLLGITVVLLVFGDRVFGPATMQVLQLLLVLFLVVVVLRLVVGGQRR